MISINRVYKTVLTLANTDIRGNVKPSEARLLINQAVNDIYNSYLYELNRAINRENKGLVSSKISTSIEERIQYFLEDSEETVSEGVVSFPDDFKFLDSVYYDDERVDVLKNMKEFKLVKPYSSGKYPIGCIKGKTLLVHPVEDGEELVVNYYRNIRIANWTYRVIGGTEIFDPSSPQFQDIDLHSSEESNVILKTLSLCGLNLKEEDLQAFSSREENKEFNDEITN